MSEEEMGGAAVKNTNNHKLFANGDLRSPIEGNGRIFSLLCRPEGFLQFFRPYFLAGVFFHPPTPSCRFSTLLLQNTDERRANCLQNGRLFGKQFDWNVALSSLQSLMRD